jgi:hypothetical protein
MLGTTATTCMARRALAIAPDPVLGSQGTRDSALAVMTRLARRHDAEDLEPEFQRDEHWIRCFARGTLVLCAKECKEETQLRVYQARTTRFTPWADSMYREMLDSLRRSFGEARVREVRLAIVRGAGGLWVCGEVGAV